MTFEEAQAELNQLRGLANSGRDLAIFKPRISRLYEAVCRKSLRKCNCKNILQDALFEIYAQLKHYTKHMEEFKAKARLVNGVVLQLNGNHFTNANITDDVAREFLSKFPQRKNWFAVLPSEAEKPADNGGADTPMEEATASRKNGKKNNAKKRK